MAQVGRLFVAVPLTDEVRSALAVHLMSATGQRPLPGRPVPPANWHITMRFLGQTDEVPYERMLGALAEEDLGRAFTMAFGGLGAFPRASRATVLWLAIEDGSDHLGRLAASSEEAARRGGFAPEDRPFHAHLTLSRIRPHQDVRPLIEQVAAFPLSQRVDRLVVYRSHLGRGGATYEALESIPLGAEHQR